jgi:hypothetical protein
MPLGRPAEQSLCVLADKRSAPDMVTMPREDDAPPLNFRAEMNPEM